MTERTTREQLIATTCELLELQGYHATGLNQIISESGTPKGSLYYHFPGGKEELAIESIRHVGRIVLNRIRDNLAAIADPADGIQAFLENIALNVELAGFRAGGPITTIAMESASTNEALRAACAQIYAGWQAAFRDRLVAGGVAEERAQRMAVLIIGAVEGGVILCRTQQSRLPLEQAAVEIGALVRQAQAVSKRD
jgi:TetR/AcrR family transcriptional repressor of lmrAB and yxaGH operons